MNEQQAREKGLTYTGYYERSKDALQGKLDEFHRLKYKAAIITVPDNPLSRGVIGVGYSIYVEKRYRVDREIVVIKKLLQDIPDNLKQARIKYDVEVAEICLKEATLRDRLSKLIESI